MDDRALIRELVDNRAVWRDASMDPVDPAARLELDGEQLARFPDGYRHLAYLETEPGFQIKRDMPRLTGPEVQSLYDRGARWLSR